MELFHGTRQHFDKFDVSFKGTGEAGSIDACWFTDNLEGASRHALYKNRNAGAPLVYRCELASHSLIANHREPLSQQPEISDRLLRYLPISISCNLNDGRDWHLLSEPVYEKSNRRIDYIGNDAIVDQEQINLYKRCGLHGVYDWEGIFTAGYLKGTTTIIFNFSCLEIKEIIAVR